MRWIQIGYSEIQIECALRTAGQPGNRAGHPDTWTPCVTQETEPEFSASHDGTEFARGEQETVELAIRSRVAKAVQDALNEARAIRPTPLTSYDDEGLDSAGWTGEVLL